MARAINKLSARFVSTVAAPGRYGDGGNLHLVVTPSGAKKWSFLFRFGGRQSEMGLGSARDVPLAVARQRAAEARTLLADGKNPLDARRAAEGKGRRITFGEAADDLLTSMSPSWENAKHRDQWAYTLSRKRGDDGSLIQSGFCLGLIDLPVDGIQTDDVLRTLTPIWGTKAETASRLRGRIERVLDFAKAKGWRAGENPALWRGHLRNILPTPQKLQRGHHAAMDYRDMPKLMGKLRGSNGVGARALEFLVLTAARTGEVTGATWGEFDLEEALWSRPSGRMKKRRAHRVPLTPRAIEILKTMEVLRQTGAPEEVVFCGRKDGSRLSDMSLKAVLKRLGHGEFTSHGFRSSFRDWAGDETSFPREIAEVALAHVVGDETERAYRRSDALAKRRELMAAWATYCEPLEDAVTKVVHLRRKLRTPAA